MPLVMEDGTASRTGELISRELDYNGASFNAGAGAMSVRCAFTSITKRYCALLPLVKDIILNPVFPQKFVTTKSLALKANVEVNRAKLPVIAHIQSLPLIWGENHPASRILNLEHLAELTSEELVKVHRESILDIIPRVWISGKVSTDIINETVALLADFPAAASTGCELGEPEMCPAIGARTIAETTVKGQSYIQILIPAIPECNPDFYPLTVAVTHLGGYFGSRLMSNIREEKGLTYGVSCNIFSSGTNGYIVIGCQTLVGNEEIVIQEIKKELGRLESEPPDEKEMTAVRSTIESELASQLDSVFAVTSLYLANYEYGISESGFAKRLFCARNVTSAKIAEMASKYLNPQNVIISVAQGK